MLQWSHFLDTLNTVLHSRFSRFSLEFSRWGPWQPLFIEIRRQAHQFLGSKKKTEDPNAQICRSPKKMLFYHYFNHNENRCGKLRLNKDLNSASHINFQLHSFEYWINKLEKKTRTRWLNDLKHISAPISSPMAIRASPNTATPCWAVRSGPAAFASSFLSFSFFLVLSSLFSFLSCSQQNILSLKQRRVF